MLPVELRHWISTWPLRGSGPAEKGKCDGRLRAVTGPNVLQSLVPFLTRHVMTTSASSAKQEVVNSFPPKSLPGGKPPRRLARPARHSHCPPPPPRDENSRLGTQNDNKTTTLRARDDRETSCLSISEILWSSLVNIGVLETTEMTMVCKGRRDDDTARPDGQPLALAHESPTTVRLRPRMG